CPVVADVAGNATPARVGVLASGGDERRVVLLAREVEIDRQGHAIDARVEDRGIDDPTIVDAVAPHLIAVLLWAEEVADDGRRLVGGGERERPDRSEIAVVVVGIVPAVREAGSDAEPWRDGISQEQSGVGVWRPQRVEKGPREVEVLGTLVDLVADQGGPLPSFHGEAVAYRN